MSSYLKTLQTIVSNAICAVAILTGQSTYATEIVSPGSSVNGSSMSELTREYIRWTASDLGFSVPQNPFFYAAPTGNGAFAPVTFLSGTHNLNFDLTKGTPLLVSSLFWSGFFDNDQTSDPPPCKGIDIMY